MTMDDQYILSLLDKALHQQLSDAEMSELLELAGNDQYKSAFIAVMEKQFTTFSPDNEEDISYWMERKAEIYERLIAGRRGDQVRDDRDVRPFVPAYGDVRPLDPAHRDIRPLLLFRRRWWAAASIILVLGIGAYLWSARKKNAAPAVVAADTRVNTPDIPPGKDGAILTLADGSQVVLDSLGSGVIALQNGARAVIKNGELVYDLTRAGTGGVAYNTMTTPKGRQFILLLPDGTKVWLNAASSIRYPTVFSGRERKVELTGEAYFEVAKNVRLPFLVNVNDKATVEVLGTNFNVNAYEDEASINTTLLEGSVKVNGTVIKPGQQVQVPAGRLVPSGIDRKSVV